MCGGWADRLKGIVTAYILANITHRNFGIKITNLPCELTNAVIPNYINWNLNLTDKQMSEMPKISYNKIDSDDFLKNVPYIDFRKEFPAHKRIIQFTANLDYIDQFKQNKFHEKDLIWLRNMSSHQAYAKISNVLLRLSPESQNRLDEFMNRAKPDEQTKLICAHIRRGKSATIPSDPVRANDKDVVNAWEFLSAYNDSSIYKLFIATDSDAVNREAKIRFSKQIVENAGNIIHVDRKNQEHRVETCDDFRKVITDQQILSRCDVLLISHSGFSRYAAYMRNTDEGLYCILRDHSGIKKCKQSYLKNIYGVTL
ncbi:hypothetical protein LOTGIDRAFT_160339 [Lottia gigantea]|uniref:GT23 domain-containing protein n=1 Tax=Lottia gigantea TaxID=225164 RepID=V4AFW2_LOTGI|nr:hypothetical protein LOTGIDRAFT_160339 [Lottia gigantea]ESO95792.1 hypothetical protein LOTGIDRAFT_160339 [Lottia gigantea]